MSSFDFPYVDRLTTASPDRLARLKAGLQVDEVGSLGAAVEYEFVRRQADRGLPDLVAFCPVPLSRKVSSLLADPVPDPVVPSADASAWELLLLAGPGNADARMTFRFRLKSAAMKGGFESSTAGGLAAAYWEMAENAILHSGDTRTALAGYRHAPNRFEFVVADAGIGVLKSLRPTYPELRDHAEALGLALEDGVSRFGPAANRGNGFGTLFRKLAGLNGSIRFRSGDHALLVEGRSPSRATAHVVQRAAFSGFFVSICCTR